MFLVSGRPSLLIGMALGMWKTSGEGGCRHFAGVPNQGMAEAETFLNPEVIIMGFKLWVISFAFGSRCTRGMPSLDESEVAVWFPVWLLLPEVAVVLAVVPGFELGSDPEAEVAGEAGTEKSPFMSRGSGVLAP